MTQVHLAIPASILLLSLSIPSSGQTTDEPRSEFAPRVMQAPAQAPVQASAPVQRTLSDEEMGDLYMARKQYREAAQTYKHLSDLNPRSAIYFNKLGIAMHQQEALGLALKMYERAVRMDPRYADAQNNIGTIWYQRKKYGKAIKAYNKAIALRNDMAVLYSNLGYAYFGEKKYPDAIVAFRQALFIDPQIFERGSNKAGSVLQDRSVGDRGRFYFMLAKSFAEAGNLERCMLYLRKAKDEGYKDLADVKKDPSFSAVLRLPELELLLAPPAPAATAP